jgi:outer membrane protein OmpA-like peptidoglycan-associated protein/opacity protein-like surface antigen
MRKLATVLAAGTSLLAAPALGRDGAWYVGGDFGAMIVEDVGFEFGAGPPVPGSDDAQVVIDHEYGFDGALFVGYDLGAFRLEAEVAYKQADLKDFETAFTLPPALGSVPPGAHPGTGNTSALSFMINGMLDFGDDDGLSGFVGGGVGVGRINYNNVRVYENLPGFVDGSDSKLAWQVFAGVRQAISDNIDVTVRYRFFNVDNIKTVDFGGFESESRFRSHSLLGGITFNFGAPPPPPPEPVATPVPPPVSTPAPPPAQPVSRPVAQCNSGPFIVFFDWDKDEITPQAATILDNAASAYASCGTAPIVIAGHADRSGTAQYNAGLSQRRAVNVSAYLTGRGVPVSRIRTEAFGEDRPRVPTADGVSEVQNRRVEITYGPGSGW